MTVSEFIDFVNSSNFYSLGEVEDVAEGVKRVASGLDLDEHRWYSTAIDVYKCSDGFVGVFGAYQSFSEAQMWSDIDILCEAEEYEEYTTVSYRPKS
jgi:hypothetical protein